MGKGQIIDNLGEGRYSVKLLYDRTKADKELAQIDRWIALNQERQDAVPSGDPEHKLPGLKLAMASLLKQKEYLLKIPPDPTVSAWCADYTGDLSGTVGTIEINGDPGAGVNIRPGYADDAAHDPDRDGQSMNIRAMTPEQAFYNLAMMPGWQKWRPTYRAGVITEISGDTCNVTLDAANSSLASNGTGPLNINQGTYLADVDIEYMDCNGRAFEAGDRVLVQFEDQNFSSPRVIGFESKPKPCSESICFFATHSPYSSMDATVRTYRADGTIWKEINLRSLLGIPEGWDDRSYILFGDASLNYLVVNTHVINWRGYTAYGFTDIYPVKVPMDFHGENKISYDIVGVGGLDHYRHNSVQNLSGLTANVSSIYAWDDFDIYLNPLNAASLAPSLGRIYCATGAWYTSEHSTLNPSDSFRWDHFVYGLAFYGDTIIIAATRMYFADRRYPTAAYMTVEPTTREAFIGIFPAPVSVTTRWQGENGVGGFLSTILHRYDFAVEAAPFEQFMISDVQTIYQMLTDDAFIYVIWAYNSDPIEGHFRVVEVATFDHELNLYQSKQQIDEGHICGHFSILQYQKKRCLCYYKWGSGAVLRDMDDNFALVGTIPLSGLTQPLSFLAAPLPVTNYMLECVNAYRFEQSGQVLHFPLQADYVMPIWYLGYSKTLEACAHLHANWCVANCRAQHEGENGTNLVHERAAVYGFRTLATGENLALIETMKSVQAEIDECLRIWKESPGHNLNLVNRDLMIMGYASAYYPEACHTIILGPGVYNPETHEYTTEPTERVLDPGQYGRMKLYVYNVAEG